MLVAAHDRLRIRGTLREHRQCPARRAARLSTAAHRMRETLHEGGLLEAAPALGVGALKWDHLERRKEG